MSFSDFILITSLNDDVFDLLKLFYISFYVERFKNKIINMFKFLSRIEYLRFHKFESFQKVIL